MDMGTVVVSIASSSLATVVISGIINYASQRAQSVREDKAIRRQIRGYALDFASEVRVVRFSGLGNVDTLATARAVIKDLLTDRSDRTALKALTDEEASTLDQAVRSAESLIARMTEVNGLLADAFSDSGKSLDTRDVVRLQKTLRDSAIPTFSALRRFFELDGARTTLAEFDKVD